MKTLSTLNSVVRSVMGVALLLLTTALPGRADVDKLNVGYLPNIVFPQALVGFHEGAFAKQLPGVSLEAKTYPAGPEALEALRAGVIDIAYTGPFPAVKAFVKAQDVILLGGSARGGTELVVKSNSPYKKLADLKGKTIGVNQAGSTVDATVRFALLQAGLVPDRDVRIIEVEPAQQADALARGEVDAVSAPAPWPSVVKLKGGRALLSWRKILDNGKYWAGVYYTTRKFAAANPNLIRRFVNANNAITRDLNRSRTKGNDRVLAAWSAVSRKKLEADVAASAFETIIFSTGVKLAEFDRIQEVALRVGHVKSKGDLNGFLYKK